MTDSISGSPFRLLSEEIIVSCFSFLDQQAACRLASVCNLFKRLSNDDEVWKSIYLASPHKGIESDLSTRPWKERVRWVHELTRTLTMIDAVALWKLGYFKNAVPISKEQWLEIVSSPLVQTDPNQIDSIFTHLLMLIDAERVDEAYKCFLEHQARFIKESPLSGWWIHTLLSVKQKKKYSIYTPNSIRKNEQALLSFMQGSAQIWLRQKKLLLALVSLDCCRQIYKRFTPQQSLPQCPIPILANIARLRRNYTPQDSVRILSKIANLSDRLSKGVAMDLVQALCEIDQADRNIVLRIVRFFHQNMAQDMPSTKIISDLVHLVKKYKLQEYYDFFIDNLSRKSASKHAARMFLDLIELSWQRGKIDKAVYFWVKSIPHRQFFFDEDFFKTIYTLIDQSEEARASVLALEQTCEEIIIAQAYALLPNSNAAFLHLFRRPKYRGFDVEDQMEWLFKMVFKNFKAALAYSLFLKDKIELTTFFDRLLDDTGTRPCFIYYDLAVRLYFEGHPDEALKNLKLAEQRDPHFAGIEALQNMIDNPSKANFYTQNELLITPLI